MFSNNPDVKEGQIKAISLRQPWALYVASGIKTIETRTWHTAHTGPLLIHASGKWDNEARQAQKQIQRHCPEKALKEDYRMRGTKVIIGIVNIIRAIGISLELAAETKDAHLCVPIEMYQWPKWGYELQAAELFYMAVPCKGMLRLWTPPEEAMNEVSDKLNRGWIKEGN